MLQKHIRSVGIAIAVVSLGVYLVMHFPATIVERRTVDTQDYKDGTYMIDGVAVKLTNGFVESEIAPGSASKIVTRYFGDDLVTDLNNDGKEDVVFLLTQETGGSGTFFYVVVAINTGDGYVGSDGYFLGDRIAPQTIEMSRDLRHTNVVVVNYAVRREDQPMNVQPAIGKSTYLKLDSERMQWGIVEANFEGESQ